MIQHYFIVVFYRTIMIATAKNVRRTLTIHFAHLSSQMFPTQAILGLETCSFFLQIVAHTLLYPLVQNSLKNFQIILSINLLFSILGDTWGENSMNMNMKVG